MRNNLLFSSHPVESTLITQGDYIPVNELFSDRPFNTSNRRQCFNLSIVNDDAVENAESFNVTIANAVPSTSVNVTPDVVTITILDGDRE